jgi:hypothetical protein
MHKLMKLKRLLNLYNLKILVDMMKFLLVY